MREEIPLRSGISLDALYAVSLHSIRLRGRGDLRRSVHEKQKIGRRLVTSAHDSP
jgi:hypothetical protein